MSTSAYNIVVVGGDSNSLTAAAFLAKLGKKVLVLENHECGGVVSMSPASDSINGPHAVALVTAVASPVIANDEMEGRMSRNNLTLLALMEN